MNKKNGCSFVAVLFLLSAGGSFDQPSAGTTERGIQKKQTANQQQYIRHVEEKFRRSYFPPPDYDYCKIIVSFKLSSRGQISRVQLLQRPREWQHNQTTPLADKSVIDAVEHLVPLPAPPVELGCPVLVTIVLDGRTKGPMKINTVVSDAHTLICKPQTGNRRSKPRS